VIVVMMLHAMTASLNSVCHIVVAELIQLVKSLAQVHSHADGSACPTVQPPQLVTVDSPLPGRPVNLCFKTDVRPYHPLVHLRSTIQLSHVTLLVFGMMALSVRLPLRLLGAGDAWQPT
jgi:hypothetical protein